MTEILCNHVRNKPFLVGGMQCCVFKFMWHLQTSKKSQMTPVLKTASNCLSVKPPRFSSRTKPTHRIQTQMLQRPGQLPWVLHSALISTSLPQEAFVADPPSRPAGRGSLSFIHSSRWGDMNGMAPRGPGKVTVTCMEKSWSTWGIAPSPLREQSMPFCDTVWTANRRHVMQLKGLLGFSSVLVFSFLFISAGRLTKLLPQLKLWTAQACWEETP